VWGDYACFTRPEMKVERVSYDVITPSSARAIFEAIMWKPAIKWNVCKIEVIKPGKWVSVRRNEVGKIFAKPSTSLQSGNVGRALGLNIEEERQQRAGLFLKDVKYRLHGYFDFIPTEKRKNEKLTENLHSDESQAKYAAMFERRATKGQCFNQPYLGCREFSCHFKLVDPEIDRIQTLEEDKELGWMLYDMDFTDPVNPTPMFFKAVMKKGVINTDMREIEVRK
jgi:CRISPR-associated protein Cas5d